MTGTSMPRLAPWLLALAAAMSAAAAPAQVPNGGYEISSRASGLCLTVSGPGVVQVQQFPCHGGQNQIFGVFQIDGSPFYEIVSQASGLCMDVENGFRDPGTRVFQYDCHGDQHQQFALIPGRDGSIQIRARHSDHCLETPNWYAGTGLFQGYCDNPDLEIWWFRRVN